MPRLLIMTSESNKLTGLGESLKRNGVVCSFTSYRNGFKEAIDSQRPDMLLYEINERLPDTATRQLIQGLRKEKHLPVIAIIPREILDGISSELNADDFIIGPCDPGELALRINRLLYKTGSRDSDELIQRDDLVIDLARCEVTVEGRIVELTFKEYEMLKLLAGHPGRVYTREALLDKIWGYDYFGGDRTVDVHVRRLRSKIEDSNHSFIETVRNIGYRFRREA